MVIIKVMGAPYLSSMCVQHLIFVLVSPQKSGMQIASGLPMDRMLSPFGGTCA